MQTKPHYWQKACKELSKKDKVMATLVKKYNDCYLTSNGDPLRTLVRAIVGQRISVAACDAVWNRLLGLFPRKKISAKVIKDLKEAEMRKAGLSKQKILYINNIADFFIENKITKSYFKNTDSEKIAQDLLAIKGIGKWTLEMFQIFYLNEPDIFSIGDLGLIKAIKNLYPRKKFKDKEAIENFAKNWSPYRTVATWYLWRSIDADPVQY